jgi:hypothetical protein
MTLSIGRKSRGAMAGACQVPAPGDALEEISSTGYGGRVTPAEARIEIRRRAIARRVRFSPHALERMNERFVRPPDVYSALEGITSCKKTDQQRWRVVGPDRMS